MLSKLNYFSLRGSAACLVALVCTSVSAQQIETSVACDENAEPVAIAYGDHGTGCAISPATETDRFVFQATAEDLIDLTLRSSSTNMDPEYEIRDSQNMLLATGQCSNIGCSVTERFVVPATDTYLVLVRDAGGNESGSYQIQLELIDPPPLTVMMDYDSEISDAINQTTDIDHYGLEIAAGTTIRLLARSSSTNMDPTFELRDPTGAVYINGAADGAQCTNIGCVVDLTRMPTVSGTYSLIIYDGGRNESGGYQLNVWCIDGDCPGSQSSTPLAFDMPISGQAETTLDGDFYAFTTTANTLIGLTARSSSSNLDPVVEIRDSSGVVIINGAVDGATCTNINCSFSIEFIAPSDDTYTLLIHDSGTNESGGYQVGLWCVLGDCDGDGEDDRFDAALINYVETIDDALEIAIDGDFYTFYAVTGTELQLNGRSSSTNTDPRVVVRDTDGNIVLDGAADGAQCSNIGCTFSVPFAPASSGFYTLFVADADNNEPGSYQLSIWCLDGPCDSDADGLVDNYIAALNYGDAVSDSINTQLDSDFFEFNGEIGDEIRFDFQSSSTNMDPTVVIRDPGGAVIVNGVADGASCTNIGCTFDLVLNPTSNGRHTMMIFDSDVNESGGYTLSLSCEFSPGPDFICADVTPSACVDNCTAVANPAQRDTDGDGAGNYCDADFDNDGVTNVVDLGQMRSVFFMSGDLEEDMNGDGVVNVIDLGLLRSRFFQGAGPTCAEPNQP